MGFLPPTVLSLVSIIILFVSFKATGDSPLQLSLQGCRMSYMSPSYLLQEDFNTSWTPLARRYSLWLYREVGWEHELNGQPVLFIPGNAGSSRQVRSIASSSTRQYFSEPYKPALSTPLKPADYFALEFNEDLSALHGPTLESQRKYAAAAISYILSLYPQGTSIIVMGHSMGGIVATALLPSQDIAAVITMSTPHTLPPARFDARIEDLYEHTRQILKHDSTPILSLCGGATDAMIPSEACILPSTSHSNDSSDKPYRRTVFASALEGAWTGVGHREMVWCHQVRWRVARAALELSAAHTPAARRNALDKWLTDGTEGPARVSSSQPQGSTVGYELQNAVDVKGLLNLRNPFESKSYTFTVTEQESRSKFTVLLGGGAIPPFGPQHALSLRANVFRCSTSNTCWPLHATTHKLIPHPVPGRVFPVPNEGSGESEGVVLYQVDYASFGVGDRIAIDVEHAEGQGWLAAEFSNASEQVNGASTFAALLGSVNVPLDSTSLSSTISLPNLINNVLVVYRLKPHYNSQSCTGTLLAPLLSHASPYETHYHPLHSERPILLHTHASAPFLPARQRLRGMTLHVHSSGDPGCAVDGVTISVDMAASIGRWGARLWPALATSAVGVAVLVLFDALGRIEDGTAVLTVTESLAAFIYYRLPSLLAGALVVALLPLPAGYALGTAGEPLFAPLAPLVVLLATGLACVMWGVLRVLLWAIGTTQSIASKLLRSRSTTTPTGPRAARTAALSLLLIFALVFLLVPWQVAFLGAWAVHLHTCASARSSGVHQPPQSDVDRIDNTEQAVLEPLHPDVTGPRRRRSPAPGGADAPAPILPDSHSGKSSSSSASAAARAHLNEHILLLLTWLLPLAAPVLAVWVRTLLTAGWTAPFDGDHNALYVAPFLVLVDYASWARRPVLERHRREPVSARWLLVAVAAVAFLYGARHTYRIFDVTSFTMFTLVACRLVPYYFQ